MPERTVIDECRQIIDREFKRLFNEQPNLTVKEIMSLIRNYKPKPSHGGMYPYRSWSKAFNDYWNLAEEIYKDRR